MSIIEKRPSKAKAPAWRGDGIRPDLRIVIRAALLLYGHRVESKQTWTPPRRSEVTRP
jgi:hypothetical protein